MKQRDLPFATTPLDRVEAPTPDDFVARYRDLRRPVIISGATSEWTATTKWTDAYLRERAGDRTVPVFVSPDRYFPGGRSDTYDGQTRTVDGRRFEDMALGAFLDRRQQQPADGDPWQYLYQCPPDLLPELADDYTLPSYAVLDRAADSSLWISRAGTITPPHYDSSDVFLVQVRGHKRVVLLAPENQPYLYLHGADHRYSRQSQIFDLEQVDTAAFPEVTRAQGFEGTIGPGELVYMPAFWWHYIHSLDDSISVSVSSFDANRYGAVLYEWRTVQDRIRAALPDELSDAMKNYVMRALV